jgi:penicillin-binding protein 2
LISPFTPDVKWDLKEDHFIEKYENPAGIGSCKPTGEYVTVEPWVFEVVQEGMRQATIYGTLSDEEELFGNFPIPVAGKTGTAEYCDAVALRKNLCIPGNWPTHSWTVAYAPYDNPEIAVVAFLYNGGEGASVAGPVVRQVIEAYFNLKAIDAALGAP